VSQSKEGHAARELVIKGPVGLLMTTTANFLHGEDETRVLSLHTDQSPEQIKRALAATLLDCPSAPSEDELARWHALHNYVCSGDHRVQIPYNRILIDRLPTQQRVLRDAPKVLALIAAHTLLNQCSRKRNEAGQIVAEIYDYYIVHDLIAEPLSQGLQASVAPHIREVVESVALLLEDKNDGNPIGISDLCDFLGKENSTVSRNVQAAIRDGYLDNLNPGQGRRHALIPGERALPSGSVLPDPEELDQAFKKTRNK
jgi:hypothetical protein